MITDLRILDELKKKYYDAGFWSHDTIESVWTKQVDRYSDKPYVKDNYISHSYAEVDEMAGKLAAWLTEVGVRNGDVVTFQMPTWAEFCVVYVAALKVGAVMHPLPKNFNDEDLVRAMNLVESVAFICPTFEHKTDYENQALLIKDRIPSLRAIAVIDKLQPAKSSLPTLSSIVGKYDPIKPGKSGALSDDVACILSTSGTTGIPKAVLLTHNNILFSERSMVNGFHLTENDIAYMASPLNHATGFFHGLIAPMISGGTCVLDERFVADKAIDRINSEKCTWSMAATPFIYDLLTCMSKTDKRAETLKLFMCGGAPLPSTLVQCAYHYGITLCEIYGSTESCPHAFVPPEKCLDWSGAWSGIPFDGIEVKVANNDVEVPNGEQGEELSRGPHLFVGYYNNEGANQRALTPDGWFRSGDLCYQDDKGRIRINGRKKEIIIRGGENISANEIDAALVGCPGITDHATIGMPDDRLGERICTFVVCSEESPAVLPSVKSLTEYLESKHIQKRLWPERVEVIGSIPRTSTGKTKRHLLADEIKRRMKIEQESAK
ncbi:AMP-dependent synthetase [Berryella intestinalis]|uniref:AMP-dependent synthetase n=1 Tax=Berryella intestinalis TaxID=1531429 RepID=A0A0A8BB73_9ACTN|nr:AMP-binding protein [Berryella intestinalis]AJC12432.1 AMP-dependent synthetase [Berryella intestinalis]